MRRNILYEMSKQSNKPINVFKQACRDPDMSKLLVFSLGLEDES